MERQKVILRFIDGRIVRGFLGVFSVFDNSISVEDELSVRQMLPVNELKAVFFVRTFEGNKSRSERKSFIGPVPPGRRVFVRFKDGESMMGYLEGDLPWRKGFFLEQTRGNGFFLIPVDAESNNIKVFVVANSVWDVTVMG
jgi:hypothetical protein